MARSYGKPLKASDLSRPSPGTDPGVRATPIRIEDPRGQALAQVGAAQEQFGRTMHSLGVAAQGWAERRKTAEDGVGIDSRQLEVTKRLSAKQAEWVTNPSDDPNFLDQADAETKAIIDQVDAEYNESHGRLSSEGQRRWSQVGLNIRANSAARIGPAINDARVFKLGETTKTNISAIGESVRITGDYEGGLERARASVAAIESALPIDKRRAFLAAAEHEIALQAITGYLERAEATKDPEAAALLRDRARAISDSIVGKKQAEEVENTPGMVIAPNINLADRPPVEVIDDQGKKQQATVRSISITVDDRAVLIPTIAEGRELTEQEAVNRFFVTKQHLGIFESVEEADAYGRRLSGQQDALINGKLPRAISGVMIDQAKKHGVDPVVYLAIGWIESKLNPNAKNPDSSAAGLLQFISDTGQQYGLPSDARAAGVLKQAEAGAAFTADNILKLRQRLRTEPTPGEVYLAHFLGLDGATTVIEAGGDTPLTKLISKKAINANNMHGWTAADLEAWANEKMQGAMEYVTDGEFIAGRKVDPRQSAIPLDSSMQLAALVDKADKAAIEALEKQRKELADSFDLGKNPEDRDPLGYVIKHSAGDRVAQAFANAEQAKDALDTEEDEKAAAWRAAVDVGLEEQKKLPGATEANIKALPNAQAKRIVQQFEELNGPAARDNFYALKAQSGDHWERIFPELVQQGLPPAYQILNAVDTFRNPAMANFIAGGLNPKEADLKKNLDPTRLKEEITDPLREDLAPYRQIYTDGYDDGARKQFDGFMDAITNAAMVKAGQTGDYAAAKEMALRVISENFTIVEAGNVKMLVPAEEGLSESDLEDAAELAQDKARVEAWGPMAVSDYTGKDTDFDKERTLSAASNTSEDATLWTQNEKGDGMILMVRMRGDYGALHPLVRTVGGKVEYYEVKWKDVPGLALEARARYAPKRGMSGRVPRQQPKAEPAAPPPKGGTHVRGAY